MLFLFSFFDGYGVISHFYGYKMIKRPDLAIYNRTHIKCGKKNGNWKGGMSHCKDCNKLLSTRSVLRCKSCENKRRYKNKNNHPMFGKTSTYKRFRYRSIWFKSSWEVLFAKWLDLQEILWKYEFKTFKLKNTTYTPDFYIPLYDVFVEIKGWQRRNKPKLLKQRYSHINIKLFDRKKIRNYIGISYRELDNLASFFTKEKKDARV